MSIEFNLLYRWHSLIPDALKFGDKQLTPVDYTLNNQLFGNHGLKEIIEAASSSPAGRFCLHNVPAYMQEAEVQSLKMSRTALLPSFNDYREACEEGDVSSIIDFYSEIWSRAIHRVQSVFNEPNR